MKYYFFLLLLFCCHPDRNKPVELEEIKFQTTDQSEIYFKNIRRSYYHVEELPDAGIEIYRSKKYFSSEKYFIRPVIVYNWRNDFASIILEAAEWFKHDNYSFIFEQLDKTENKILFEPGDHQAQTQMALKIYNAILTQQTIYIIKDRQKELFFNTDVEKETFRITIFDFLRLVEMR